MINQPPSETQTNQYGFYAIPKAVEPKKKYRESQDQYEDQEEEDNKFMEIDDRQLINEKDLPRDYYVDEAPFPEFKPKERGLDYGVQIQRGDLFDFDLQVRPMIQILVGRACVTAINQLQQQKETIQKRQQLANYQKKRNAQLMVTQRMQAKDKRKKQQAERRKLQKQTYMKNKKQLQKKMLARKNGKRGLLGLRQQIFNELDEAGFLRDNPIVRLKANYQGWLYEQVTSLVQEQEVIRRQINDMQEKKKKQLKNEHNKNIEKQLKRRQDLLNERQRIRKANEQRKRKKKIRKQRLQLRSQRQPKQEQFIDNVSKHEPIVGKILKSEALSNGRTKSKNTKPTIYLSGGLLNYLLVFLESTSQNYSKQQIQNLIHKLLTQLETKLQIQVSVEHLNKINEVKKKLEEQGIAFMKNKQHQVQELANSIAFNLQLLQSMGISIKSQLHSNLIFSLLNIYLTAIPPEKDGQTYEPTEKDKKYVEIKSKIEFVSSQESQLETAKQAESILRIHFEYIEQEQQKQQESKQQQEVQKTQQELLNEWIDIYDGQGWDRRLKEIKQKGQKVKSCDKAQQNCAGLQLNNFENSYVFDQRVLHYIEGELEGLLQVKTGQKLQEYKQALSNIGTRLNLKQKTPVYDTELLWE